jgi:FkbM family methyltransferase
MTVAGRADCDPIPKVDGAGEIVDGVQLMHNGVRVVAGGYYGDWMAEIIRQLRGHHEPQEELVIHNILARLGKDTHAPVIVELGAFWAYYALWALHVAPAASAILVEPDPQNLEIGRRNFALNGRSGTFIHAAVGGGNEPAMEFTAESDQIKRETDVLGLDEVMTRGGAEHVDLLMLDVQGAETAFLHGAKSRLTAGTVRFLVASTHHHGISGDALTHERCLRILLDAGAHVIVEHPVYESCSGDGLIAVSFDERDRDMTVEVRRIPARNSLFGEPLEDLAAAHESIRASRLAAEEAARERAQIVAHAASTAGLESVMQQHLIEAESRVAHLESERDSLVAELESLRRSRSYRLMNHPRRAYRLLRRLRGEQR